MDKNKNIKIMNICIIIAMLIFTIAFSSYMSFLKISKVKEIYFMYPMLFVMFLILVSIVLLLISIVILVLKKKKVRLLYCSGLILFMSILYVVSGLCSINFFKKSIEFGEEKSIVSELEYYENDYKNHRIATDSIIIVRENASRELLNLIWGKCAKMEPTYFLDYLSKIEFSNLNDFEFILISAMQNFNIAIDPMYRGAPLEAIKQLNKICDLFDFDFIKKYIDLDVKTSIKNIEMTLILKKNYNKDNNIYFGRLNNSTPISFQLIDKIDDDYLLLQDSVFDCNFDSDEIYKNGEFILKDNDLIKNCFEIENDLIKDIFVLSESDFDKYKRSNKKVSKYLDLELNKEKIDKVDTFRYKESYPCEIDEKSEDRGKHTSYFVMGDSNEGISRVFDGKKFVDVNNNQKSGVRLAILVKGIGK